MAQRGLNKVCLIGYLGQDPEIRYTADKQPVAVFSVATGDSWKDKETGETKERTQWHRIVVYNKLAEIAAAYLKKGTQYILKDACRSENGWTVSVQNVSPLKLWSISTGCYKCWADLNRIKRRVIIHRIMQASKIFFCWL